VSGQGEDRVREVHSGPISPFLGGRVCGPGHKTLREARPTHTCVASIPTSLLRRRTGSGAPVRGSGEERRLISKGGARPSYEPEREGGNALPAARGRVGSCAEALDPDPPPITPAPDTPRGFSG